LKSLKAAVTRGPHVSSLVDDDIEQIQHKAREKVTQGFAKIYLWEELKKNLPAALKLSSLVMIPHKLWKYWAIPDLSFALLVNGFALPSVNKATEKCAPEEAMCLKAPKATWLK